MTSATYPSQLDQDGVGLPPRKIVNLLIFSGPVSQNSASDSSLHPFSQVNLTHLRPRGSLHILGSPNGVILPLQDQNNQVAGYGGTSTDHAPLKGANRVAGMTDFVVQHGESTWPSLSQYFRKPTCSGSRTKRACHQLFPSRPPPPSISLQEEGGGVSSGAGPKRHKST